MDERTGDLFGGGNGGGGGRRGIVRGPRRTVAAVRRELLTLADAGHPGICPCCDHRVQFYRRKFHRTMALDVIWLEYQRRRHGDEFVRVKHRKLFGREYAADTSDLGKLKHWGLAEPMPNEDPTKKTSGYWRITKRGTQLMRGEIKVRQYAVIYLDRLYRYEGPEVSISSALGKRFDYSELMGYRRDWWDE